MLHKTATLLFSAALAAASQLVAGDVLAAEQKAPLRLALSPRIDAQLIALTQSGPRRQQRAVSMARSGRIEPAARILTALHERDPDNQKVIFDLLSVLSWQGSHVRATALARQIDPGTAPLYVVEAAAVSARRSASFDDAIAWYEVALKRDRGNVALLKGLALSYADAGRSGEAASTFGLLPLSYRSSLDGVVLSAQLARARGDDSQALLAFEQALAAAPDNQEAQLGKLRTLKDMLLPGQALEFAAQHPGLASAEDIAALQVDQAALWVRWGADPVESDAGRFADLDKALQKLQANMRRFSPDSELGRISRFDYIAALHARGRYADAINAFQSLSPDEEVPPAYVLRAAAGAQLESRNPEEALRLYNLALEQEPENFELNFDRFFALVELERHDEARALADDLVFSQDIWLTVPGSRVVKQNPRRLKAELLRALAHAYAGDLVTAEGNLQDMLAEAPHNTDVRQELGNVYRWRGWPRRALDEYLQVFTVEEDLLSARVGLANTYLDLGMGDEFEDLFAQLKTSNADDGGVRRLVRRHELFHRNALSVSANGGRSSGEQFGSRQHLAEARLSLGALGYHWRPYLHLHDSRAEFSEGTAQRRRAGIGLQYRSPGHTLDGAISASVKDQARTGIALAYTRDFSDKWQLSALAETESNALPLRGWRAGISADRLRLGAVFRQSESRQISLSAETLDFSDGNLRRSILVAARQRLLNRPRLKFDLTATAYASSNDLTDVVYFSPSSDRALSVAGDARWLLFRRYERSFEQQLIVELGRYDQSGFEPGTTGSVEFRQLVQISGALDFYLGVRRARALYDGGFEYGTFYQGGLRSRF